MHLVPDHALVRVQEQVLGQALEQALVWTHGHGNESGLPPKNPVPPPSMMFVSRCFAVMLSQYCVVLIHGLVGCTGRGIRTRRDVCHRPVSLDRGACVSQLSFLICTAHGSAIGLLLSHSSK